MQQITEILKWVGSFLFSILSAAGIIAAVSKFLANRIADRLEEKHKADLQKEIEKYKNELEESLERYRHVLEGRVFVTKTQFETEFQIYRALSKGFFEVILYLCRLFEPPYSIRGNDKETLLKKQKECCDLLYDTQNTLHENSPFIKKEFYDRYSKVLNDYHLLYADLDYIVKEYIKSRAFPDDSFFVEKYHAALTAEKDYVSLCNDLRNYLFSLTIIE